MLRRMMRRSISLAVLAASVLAPAAWPASTVAQSGGSSGGVRLPPDACVLASTDELSALHPDVTLTLAITSPGACNYAGSPPDMPFAGARLTVAAKPASLADIPLEGEVRDVTIAGSTGRVGQRDVIVVVGPWLLRVNGIIPAADPSAWLVAAAEIVVPRLAVLANESAQGPICARFGAAAAGRVLGVRIVQVTGDADHCDWSTGDDGSANILDSYIDVQARVLVGDFSMLRVSLQEGEYVDVDGRTGFWMEEKRRLLVDSGVGGILEITFVMAPAGMELRDLAFAFATALFEAGVA
jgi:hypothetical protein